MAWVSFPFGETATVLRPGPATKDVYGNQVPGPVVETAVPGCVWSPSNTIEAEHGEDLLHVDGRLYMPPNTDVRYTDQIRFRGNVYDVFGQPTQVVHPRTGTHGPLTVSLKQVV